MVTPLAEALLWLLFGVLLVFLLIDFIEGGMDE